MNVDSIREQFPILAEKVYGRSLVYLDNAATTQKPRAVIDTVNMMHLQLNGNIHRGIHYMAEKSTELYENARTKVREFLHAGSNSEIVFTSGATASINLVAYCFSEKFLHAGDNIIVTEMEHHSNIVPWQLQTERKSASLRYIPVKDDGTLELSVLEKLADDKTRLVAVTATSNVLGTDNDIEYLADWCHRRGIPILVDGSQAVQHSLPDVSNVDFYVFSGHKIFAPTGIGVLYGRENWLEQMPPFMCGGDMISTVSLTEGTTWADLPLKFEAGTSNYMGAVALGSALDWYGKLSMDSVSGYLRSLADDFTEKLKSAVDGVTVYGSAGKKGPIVSFNIEGCHPLDIAQIADRYGVALRSGTQCAQPLMARFGVDAVCRASMAVYNTFEENEMAVAAIAKAVKMFRK